MTTLPKEISVGYLKVKVDMFIPNPMQSLSCNNFGLTSQGAKQRLNVQTVERRDMKEDATEPRFAQNAMVVTLRLLEVAPSG